MTPPSSARVGDVAGAQLGRGQEPKQTASIRPITLGWLPGTALLGLGTLPSPTNLPSKRLHPAPAATPTLQQSSVLWSAGGHRAPLVRRRRTSPHAEKAGARAERTSTAERENRAEENKIMKTTGLAACRLGSPRTRVPRSLGGDAKSSCLLSSPRPYNNAPATPLFSPRPTLLHRRPLSSSHVAVHPISPHIRISPVRAGKPASSQVGSISIFRCIP